MQTAYTTDQLAARWGMPLEMVRRHIRGGEIPAFRVGREYRIPLAWIESKEDAWKKETRRFPYVVAGEEGAS
jgi:excisionase family DNA binding protein